MLSGIRIVCRRLALLAVLMMPFSVSASDPEFDEATYLQYLETDNPRLAKKAVQEFGAHQNAAGLRTILDRRDMKLLAEYEKSMPRGDNVILDAELQKLILSRFDDPGLREALLMLIHTRAYNDERLFNLIYPFALQTRKVRGQVEWINILLATRALGVEERVQELYAGATEKQRLAILGFMSQRRYEPALPLFIRAQEQFAYTDSMVHIHWLLSRMDSSAAANTLINMLGNYRDPLPTQKHHKMVTSVLMELARMSNTVAMNHSVMVHNIPYKDQVPVARAYAKLVARRGLPQAASDMFHYLQQPGLHREAFDAILAIGKPEISQQALEKLETASANQVFSKSVYRHYHGALSSSIENHDLLAAEREQQRIKSQVRHEQYKIWERYRLSRTVPERDIIAYLDRYMQYIGELEQLDRAHPRVRRHDRLIKEIYEGHTFVAHVSRNWLRNPDEAIRHYEMANRTAEIDKTLDASFTILMVAETRLFELNDRPGALADYERFRLALAQSSGEDFGDWTSRWLSYQIAWLKDGKPFAGTISRDNLRAFGLAAALLPGILRTKYQGLDLEQQADRERLLTMPRSHMLIPLYLRMARHLPEQQVAGLLAEADPTGFWRAHILGLVEYTRHKEQEKKKRGADDKSMSMAGAIMRRLDIDVVARILSGYASNNQVSFNFDGNQQFASPEQTFTHFRAAMKKGDIQTAISCFTPDQRGRMRNIFRNMSSAQLRASADSKLGKSTLDMGSYREYDIVSDTPNAQGSVIFTNIDGEWKINQL